MNRMARLLFLVSVFFGFTLGLCFLSCVAEATTAAGGNPCDTVHVRDTVYIYWRLGDSLPDPRPGKPPGGSLPKRGVRYGTTL